MRTASEMGRVGQVGQVGQKTIPLSVPHMGGNEWKYVKECLDTNWVSSVGPFVTRFESVVAARANRAHAVATTSGTAALHIALIAAGIERDDEVLMPALTFIAPANAARYVGAWPVFVDVEPRYWQLDPGKLADFVQRVCRWRDGALWNRTTERRVRGVLPVDLLGHPVDADAILDIARSRDLVVVEDATESLGARYKDRPAGSLSDIACFSFNGNKVVTSGGGGMIVTDNPAWAERARYLTTQAKDDSIESAHGAVGYNYRLTNIQAAVGVAQMEQLDHHVTAKRRIAAAYAAAFAEHRGIRTPVESPSAFCTYWLSTMLVDDREYGMDSRGLVRALADRGIESRPLWQPLHLSAAHRESQAYEIHIADTLYRQALSLPSSVGLTSDEQARVIEAVLARASPHDVQAVEVNPELQS